MFSRIVIVGRVGKKPELRSTQSGAHVCGITVAVDMGWGDKKRVEWYRVSTWGKQAEACAKCLDKGAIICVSGTPRLAEYVVRGEMKSRIEVDAETVTFLPGGAKSKGAGDFAQQPPQPDDGYSMDDIPF